MSAELEAPAPSPADAAEAPSDAIALDPAPVEIDPVEAELLARIGNLELRGHKLVAALKAAEAREAEALAIAAGLPDERERRAARKEAESLQADSEKRRTELASHERAVEWAREHLGRHRAQRATEAKAAQHAQDEEARRKAAGEMFAAARRLDEACDALSEALTGTRQAVSAFYQSLTDAATTDQKTELRAAASLGALIAIIRLRLGYRGLHVAPTLVNSEMPAPGLVNELLKREAVQAYIPAGTEADTAISHPAHVASGRGAYFE